MQISMTTLVLLLNNIANIVKAFLEEENHCFGKEDCPTFDRLLYSWNNQVVLESPYLMK